MKRIKLFTSSKEKHFQTSLKLYKLLQQVKLTELQ